jgi:AcrR family transcriptional regulator
MTFLGSEPRDRLLGAAAALCAERGYDEITEKQIATRAGVPMTRMAELFPGGKEDCFAAGENSNLLEVVAAVSHAYSADRSEWENVLFGVREVLELMAAKPGFAYLGYVFSRQMAPGGVREIYENGQRILEAMLERGWEYSQSKEQPAYAALGVLGGAQALVRREVAAGRVERLPRILPDCVYIATVPFLGQKVALQLSRQAQELPRSDPGQRVG